MTKEKFLEGVQNWNNHLYLLWPALEATSGPVVEYGMGDGSTNQLHQYCKDKNRMFASFDFNKEWADKFRHLESETHKIFHAPDWDKISINSFIDVLLIDHSPGERRWEDVKKYAFKAQYTVIHDTEPAATGYMLDKIWHLFKFRKDYKTDGAWASIVSNFSDVNLLEI